VIAETSVFSSLSKNIKNKAYKSISLPVALNERKTWSLTPRKEQRFRVFENSVKRRILGPKEQELTDYIMRSFIIYKLHQI
jgi:hypothetical protein